VVLDDDPRRAAAVEACAFVPGDQTSLVELLLDRMMWARYEPRGVFTASGGRPTALIVRMQHSPTWRWPFGSVSHHSSAAAGASLAPQLLSIKLLTMEVVTGQAPVRGGRPWQVSWAGRVS
jgi:hypothetical protein